MSMIRNIEDPFRELIRKEVDRYAKDHGAKLYDLERQIQGIELGLGGVRWKTGNGHSRYIALFTTPHLLNIIRGSYAHGETRRLIQEELARREVDLTYRAKDPKLPLLPAEPRKASLLRRLSFLLRGV